MSNANYVTRPATPESVDWSLAKLDGMLHAKRIAQAGGALTNPFDTGTGEHVGFAIVANLHHYQRMAAHGGMHQNPTFSVPQA